MQPIDRRSALALGGPGVLSMVVGGLGLFWQLMSSTLDVMTGAALGEVDGREAAVFGYNGGLPGPALRVRPGDTLRIELINQLEELTNCSAAFTARLSLRARTLSR